MAAVALSEVLNAGRRGDGEVDRLAARVGQPAQRLVGQLDEAVPVRAPLREALEDRPRTQTCADALDEALSLESRDKARGRALREVVRLGELAYRDRPRALEHADQQLRRTVDRPRAILTMWNDRSIQSATSTGVKRGTVNLVRPLRIFVSYRRGDSGGCR